MSDIQGNTPAAKVSRQQLAPSGTPQHGAMMSLSERLCPATAKQGNTELLSCLILVAPSGMTAEDRDAWLRAAKMTLSGIPADLLATGCKKARETCRFASEIVPTIIETVGRRWDERLKQQSEEESRRACLNAARLPEPECVDPAEVRKLIRSLGAA